MIHRGEMIKYSGRMHGIPDCIARASRSLKLYHNTKAEVTTSDGETDKLDIHGGVLQGDTLLPIITI